MLIVHQKILCAWFGCTWFVPDSRKQFCVKTVFFKFAQKWFFPKIFLKGWILVTLKSQLLVYTTVRFFFFFLISKVRRFWLPSFIPNRLLRVKYILMFFYPPPPLYHHHPQPPLLQTQPQGNSFKLELMFLNIWNLLIRCVSLNLNLVIGWFGIPWHPYTSLIPLG